MVRCSFLLSLAFLSTACIFADDGVGGADSRSLLEDVFACFLGCFSPLPQPVSAALVAHASR